MRYYLKKIVAIGFLLFVALWIVGAIRGMTLPYPPPPPLELASLADYSSSKHLPFNGTFANNLKLIGLEKTPLPMVIDADKIERIQIHEKAGNLTSLSTEFKEDEARLRAVLKTHQASIIDEKDSGIEPYRRLSVEVGVPPEQFDALVAQLRQIGTLASIRVEQTDRTGEFRKLHAQRQSLKKFLESVLKLRGGDKLTIDDALRLDQKIKEIENEMRTLNDQLGDFLGKESLYHVQMTLTEHQAGDRRDQSYSIPQRVFHASQWAAAWWGAIALMATLAAATSLSVGVLRQKPVTA